MTRKKVLVVLGSPRSKGNSAALAERVAQGIRKAGGQPQILRLHTMDVHPCRACDSCQRKKDFSCVQKDGMRSVYPALREAEALVIASPVYWFTMAAQTKIFMDRLYAFIGPDGHGMAGKRVGIVLTYMDTDPFTSGAVNALRSFQDSFAYMNAPITGMVYGSAGAPGEIRGNKAVMDQAFELGVKIARG